MPRNKESLVQPIVMTGGSGLVGSHLRQSFLGSQKNTLVLRADRSAEQPVNLLNEGELRRFFEQQTRIIPREGKTPVVMHLAASVDGRAEMTEAEYQAMYALNVTATEAIAHYAAVHGFPLIHFSTDYVFRGAHSREAHKPTDAIIPDSTPYSQTKAEAERIVLEAGDKTTVAIVRIGFPYGMSDHKKPEFLAKALSWVRKGQPLYDNQHTSPSPLSSIVLGCNQAIELVIEGKLPNRSILHLSGEPTTPHDFAQIAAQVYGLDEEAKASQIAQDGPRNLVLDHDATEELLEIAIPGHHAEITRIRTEQA